MGAPGATTESIPRSCLINGSSFFVKLRLTSIVERLEKWSHLKQPRLTIGRGGRNVSRNQHRRTRGWNGVLQSAAAGDQKAWDEIVDAYAALVWAVPRRHQLDYQEAAWVDQATWRRLCDRPGEMAPETLAGWLERTAERECTRIIRLSVVGERQAQTA